MKSHFDVVIVGAGVAGISAAIYLKRANIDVAIIEKNIPGGQLNTATSIENYPGFSEISGTDLAMKLYDQIQAIDVPIIFDSVLEVIDGETKTIKLKNSELTCRGLIIATGRKPKPLDLVNEEKLVGYGISYCAVCDGALFKDKKIAVVGGGNSALKEALYLSTLADTVYLIHRRGEFRGESETEKQLLNTSNIIIKYDSVITELKENDNKLSGIIINNVINNENDEINIEGLFIDVGSVPDTNQYSNLNITNERGYILVNNDMETSKPGIYACGDVIKKGIYQIVTASSDGATAALSCVRYVKKN